MGRFKADMVPHCIKYGDENKIDPKVVKIILENGVDPDSERDYEIIKILRNNSFACIYWFSALRELDIDDVSEHVLSSHQGTVLTKFDWKLLQQALENGKFLSFFIRFPFGKDHFFIVESVPKSKKARVWFAWPGRHDFKVGNILA